jgi:dTMP kinase
MAERGKYVVIEGHDGTGKTAQCELLSERLYVERGIEAVAVPEPGGTPISDSLRQVIKDGTLERDGITNLLLFTASRRELWNQVINPHLEEGKWVIAARNWYSTLAYQGYGEGVDIKLIEDTMRGYVGERYIKPDLAVILALDNETERKNRARMSADTEIDTFEQRDDEFQKRVTEAYLKVAVRVGAFAVEFTPQEDKPAVHRKIWTHVEPLLG